MTYGGILVSLRTPDRKGALGDVVLGHDSLSGYLSDPPMTFFGALIGRYANRIGHAQFTLDGTIYKLIKNNGENSLHGGPDGFDKRVWTAREVADGVELTYLSKDGEENYPGNLKAMVTYRLTEDNRLQIHSGALLAERRVLRSGRRSPLQPISHHAQEQSRCIRRREKGHDAGIRAGLARF